MGEGQRSLPKLFLGVLALAWLVVLVPPVLRARSDSRARGDSIGDFQNRLGTLGRSHAARQARRAARSAQGLAGRAPVNVPRRAPVNVARRGPGRSAPVHALAPPAPLANRPRAPRPLTGPVEPLRTRAAERSARRSREVVTVLFTTTMLSAAVAAAFGGTVIWALQALADIVFLGYLAGMLWFRSVAADRMRTVRYLPPVRPRPVSAYALRRTASS
jgi:hypothetical protein